MSCVNLPEKWQKTIKSSKMRQVRGGNDSNNMFFVLFDYRIVEKKRYLLYTDMHPSLLGGALLPLCILGYH